MPVMPARPITDFFKPFTIPKSRIPIHNTIEDEIVLAPSSPSKQPRRPQSRRLTKHASPSKQKPKPKQRGVPPPPASQSSALSSLGSSPSRPSPLKQSTKRAWTDGATDEEQNDRLVHRSPLGSRQRVLEAVEVPSPRKTTPKPPPRDATPTPTTVMKPTPQTVSRPAASFSSISTLTTIPPASQMSSSRRVVKGGMHAVTNSDSGSAEDSSDELPDMPAFVPARKKVKMTPPSAEPMVKDEATAKPARTSARLSDRGSRAGSGRSTPRPPPSPPSKRYKHSLASMAQQRAKHEKTEARIAEAEKKVLDAERAREELEKKATERNVDGRSLAAAVAGDGDEGERMLMALARTEALQEEDDFHLFVGKAVDLPDDAFPMDEIPVDARWAEILRDDASRRQACLTGFVAELAAGGKMTEEIVRWFAHQPVHEEEDELCEAYVEVVRQATLGGQISEGGISTLSDFYSLTVHTDGSTGAGPLDAVSERERCGSRSPSNHARRMPGLEYVAQVLSITAPPMGSYAVAHAVVDLCLANIDDDVIKNVRLQQVIQDCIDALTNCIIPSNSDEFHQTVSRLLLKDLSLPPSHRCRTIAALPATSPASHLLRRDLALACLTGDTGPKDLTSPIWSTKLSDVLKRAPEFHLTDSTDYALLTHLTAVLDIALDAGFSDFAFLSPVNNSATPADAPVKTSLFAPSKSVGLSEAERAFHGQVDGVVKLLKRLSSRIKDAGATHLRRMEAKSALERVIVRLEFCVRTRPRGRKEIFGGGGKVSLDAFFQVTAGDEGAGARSDEGDSTRAAEVESVEVLSNQEMSETPNAALEEDAVAGAEEDSLAANDDEEENVSRDVSEPSVKGRSAWDGVTGAVRL